MIISYAQNYEDVLLYRLFKDQAKGFYVDVGAAHPVTDSVTQLFYKLGWTGVNIEPSPDYFKLIAEQRTKDINENCAISNVEGTAVFQFVRNDPKLSSLENLSPEFIKQHDLKIDNVSVQVKTLKSIIEKNIISKIDFLKIDVEGGERKVLEGFPFHSLKPRVILIEAVVAKGNEPTHEGWESLLTDQGYVCAYFDGLNRYYVQASDQEFINRLKLPLNSNDDFVRYPHTKFKFFIKILKNSFKS